MTFSQRMCMQTEAISPCPCFGAPGLCCAPSAGLWGKHDMKGLWTSQHHTNGRVQNTWLRQVSALGTRGARVHGKVEPVSSIAEAIGKRRASPITLLLAIPAQACNQCKQKGSKARHLQQPDAASSPVIIPRKP